MAISRVYPSQDTYVAGADPSVPNVNTRYSNLGGSEILKLFKVGTSRSEILVRFPIEQIPSGSQVFLKMFNAVHSETLPSAYSVKIRPLEQMWTEGFGKDIDNYTDIGAANYYYATSNTTWSLGTGTLSSSFYFETGHENLEVDVSHMAASAQYGFDVMIDPFDPGSQYIKKFHSRHSNFHTRRPYLEARWSDWTGTLSTSSLFYVTSGDYAGTYWPASMANSSASGSGSLITSYKCDVDPTGSLMFSLYDLQSVYDAQQTVVLHLDIRKKNWETVAVEVNSNNQLNSVLTECYYRIVDDLTNEVIIDFGTGSLKHTKLSYNDSGNYFNFNMGSLVSGPVYRFDFIYNCPTGSNEWNMIRGDAFKFRVTEVTNG